MPGVAEVAVVAAPDARLGEHGCAFVRPLPGATVADARRRQARHRSTPAWPARSGPRKCVRSRSSRARRPGRSRSSRCAIGCVARRTGCLAAAADALDEQGALHLAGRRRARQLVDDLEPPRLLEAGERRRRCAHAARRGRRRRAHPGCGTTTAHTISPHVSSGRPTTATSRTLGCVASAASTSPGATVSPPVRITSRARPDDRQVPLVVDRAEVARCGTSRRDSASAVASGWSKYPSMSSSLVMHTSPSVEADVDARLRETDAPGLAGEVDVRRAPCPDRPRSTRRRRASRCGEARHGRPR